MLNFKSLVKSKDWAELKEFIDSEIVNKPLSIDTKDKTPEMIAVELRASQIAVDKIKAVIGKIERLGQDIKIDNQPFR